MISGLMYGGGQRVVLDLLERGNKEQDFEVRLVLLGCNQVALRPFAEDVIAYDGRYNRLDTLLGTARRLRHYLRARPPAVLHTHGWDADIIGWLAVQGTDAAQICHLHITPSWLSSPNPKHSVRRWLTKKAFARRATRVAAVAGAVSEHWRDLLQSAAAPPVVIHNGVDVDCYRPSQAKASTAPVVIGTAARLVPSKGISYLLEALRALAKEGLRPHCRIAGQGPLMPELKDFTRKYGLDKQVVFLGHVGDMPAFHRSIDVFVLPSLDAEGLPIAVLEAMATGVPVLATNVGGAAEVLDDGREGLLGAPGDPLAMAASLKRLLTDAGLRRRMGESARRRAVETLSVDRFADNVFDLYRDMLRQ